MDIFKGIKRPFMICTSLLPVINVSFKIANGCDCCSYKGILKEDKETWIDGEKIFGNQLIVLTIYCFNLKVEHIF